MTRHRCPMRCECRPTNDPLSSARRPPYPTLLTTATASRWNLYGICACTAHPMAIRCSGGCRTAAGHRRRCALQSLACDDTHTHTQRGVADSVQRHRDTQRHTALTMHDRAVHARDRRDGEDQKRPRGRRAHARRVLVPVQVRSTGQRCVSRAAWLSRGAICSTQSIRRVHCSREGAARGPTE
jgi:hypothetical protein